MIDLVKRLRNNPLPSLPILLEAADRIEELESERDSLEYENEALNKMFIKVLGEKSEWKIKHDALVEGLLNCQRYDVDVAAGFENSDVWCETTNNPDGRYILAADVQALLEIDK